MGVRRCLARSLTSLALLRTPKSANGPRSNSFRPDSPSTTNFPRGRKTQPSPHHTGHANSCKDMLSRLETMVLMGMELPLPAIRSQIASGIDILIHLGRMRDKSRKVLSITEIAGYEENQIILNDIYRFKEKKAEENTVHGAMEKVGELIHTEKMIRAGYCLDGL